MELRQICTGLSWLGCRLNELYCGCSGLDRSERESEKDGNGGGNGGAIVGALYCWLH